MLTERRSKTRSKRSPEMDRLKKLYLGSWDYTEACSKAPFYPQGGSDAGVYTSEPGPGGNSIVNRFHSLGAVGDFEGLACHHVGSQGEGLQVVRIRQRIPGLRSANGPIR